jgi:hypothetical protein
VSRLPRGEREEAAAEILANSYKFAVSAERRRRLHRVTPCTLVGFGSRTYRAGYRMAGSRPTDVMSEAGRVKHRYRVSSPQTPDPEASPKQQQE